MANPTVTVEIKSIGSEKVIKTLGKVRTAAKGVTTGVNKLGKATKKAGDKANRFKTKMTELGKSASLALGPLNGVAARLTAFSGLASMASFRVAGFIGGLVGAGGLVVAAVKVANSLDTMRKSAERVGLSFERFQEFQFVASQAGIGAEKFSKGMDTFVKRLGEAKRGSSAATDALKVLLGSLHEIEGIDTEEALLRTADAFQGLEGTMDGAAISANLFSKANQKFTKFLELGRKGINETSAQARRLGFIFGNDVAVNATKAVDSLDALGKVLKVNLARTIIGLLPLITRVALALASWGPVIKENIRLITTVLFSAIGTLIGLLAGLPGALAGGILGGLFGLSIASITTLEDKLKDLEAQRNKLLESTGVFSFPGPLKEAALEGLAERIKATKIAIGDQEVFISKLRDTLDLLSSLENKGAMKAYKALSRDVKAVSAEFESLSKFGDTATVAFSKAFDAAAKFLDQFDLATQRKLAADLGKTLKELKMDLANLFVERAASAALIKTFNETRTASEKLDLALIELDFTFNKLPRDMDLLARATSRARRNFIDTDASMQTIVRSFESVGDGMVDAMTTAGDAMEVLRNTARSIVDDILKTFIRLAVVNQILNSIFGLTGGAAFPTIGGGGGGKVLGGGTQPLPIAAAHGGSYRVGGFGGPDSQLVSFRATPGEVFTATPQGKAGPSGDVIINMNISTGVAATVRNEVLKLAPVIKSLVRRDIAEASRQGGRFNRAVNS